MIASLVAGLALLGTAAANPNLEKCRQLETEFDYQGMVAECSIAAADPTTTPEERVEINRLLGFAHTAIGDEDAAHVWFLRLLTLDPEHELDKEVSPRFRSAFAKAVEEFETKGAVSATHTAPDPTSAEAVVRFAVTDRLRRVTRALVEVQAMHSGGETEPVREELARVPGGEEGVTLFEGELPDPGAGHPDMPAVYQLRYRLVLENLAGAEIELEPALEPVTVDRAGGGGVGDGTGSEEDDGAGLFLWAGVAAVGSLVAVGAIAGGVTATVCLAVGCPPKRQPAPTAYVRVQVEAPAEASP